MDILNHEFLLFLSCAFKNQLKYLLVGGYAVNYYGYNRNTRDMDVWLKPTLENRDAFIQTLLCMQYSEQEVSPLLNEDFKFFKATIGSADAAIDLLTYFGDSLNFDEAYVNKESFEIEKNVFVNFVAYDTLINMKLQSKRDKDLWDIKQLDNLRNRKKDK